MPENPVLFEHATCENGAHPSYCAASRTEITLRDVFAGFAMASIARYGWSNHADAMAAEAFKLADAMLAEREKR